MLAAVDHFQRRVDDVEQPVDPAVGPYRAQVRRPAHRRGIAIEVARGHHREDRLERRIRPDSRGGEQLVDRQVGHPEHADPSVGVGQLGCPVDQLNPVLRLPGAEHLEGTAGDAAPPDVDHHLDVAPLDQIRGGAAADLGGRRRGLLAVRRHRHQHGERPGGGPVGAGLGGVMNVDAQLPPRRSSAPRRCGECPPRTAPPWAPTTANTATDWFHGHVCVAIAALASPPPARIVQTVKIR